MMKSPFSLSDDKIKTPNVSGQFYSADKKQLSDDINRFFAKAAAATGDQSARIIIVPHAGYPYSGGVAAYGFKAVSQRTFKTIIILAPSHFQNFDGISIWAEGGFQTPLGTVPVDSEMAQKLLSHDEKFFFSPQPFAREHSLEVELPFLQKTFRDFKIVPVVMGYPRYETLEKFAAALKDVVGSREDILIVVSTDLSHYHEDAIAQEMDSAALDAIKGLQAPRIYRECYEKKLEMCGFIPVTAALIYAKLQGYGNVTVLKHATSGEVTGDKSSVVGYSAVTISPGEIPGMEDKGSFLDSSGLTKNEKARLIQIARQSLENIIRHGKVENLTETDPRLAREEGAFVTFHNSGRLRGCIGNILGRGPLYLTVRDMAVAAATQDPRFRDDPIDVDELKDIDVEVSVLSKPQPIKNVSEIVLGKNGVIVSQGPFHRGLFLPQVAAETGWGKEEFLSQLCAQKAGLPPDAWKDPKTTIEIFTAEVFSEKDLR